jgi:hypothetical protein
MYMLKTIKICNIYKSGSQNGSVYSINGISPTIMSGQGVVGNGIGSCNAPKIMEIIYEH